LLLGHYVHLLTTFVMPPKSKSIEETYKKLTQRQHVLERSGMYIGDIKKHHEEQWIFDSSKGKMTKTFVEFSPGFMKIFDEVLTNATDHATRDPTVASIKVDYDTKTGEISVWNNGSGVPVVIHKEHNLYVPELIFGQLLSGSNYDDTQQRIGAGTNGVGIKCTNIYSTRFVVETVDSERGLKFVQEYSNNMETKSEPKITKSSVKSYTKITFLPDYKRFSMRGLERDTCMLIDKRVYDCIACTNQNVGIYLNGEKLRGKGLSDYIKYFFDQPEQFKVYNDSIVQKVGSIEFVWEYAIVPWERFEHVSFVNGNSTYAGGKHVDHIVYQITNKLKSLLETKKKLKDVKPAVIREKLFLFLRATIVNPQFNSQTKECLTTQAKDFGCKIEVGEKFIEKLWKSSIVDEIVEFCKIKENLDLAKSTDGKKKTKIFVPKLEDALWAGTAKSDLCTLILTEGDSAKTFALWGRSVVGPERFGVFPLKGKCISEDTEIPLWNGDIKLAKDIQIGDILIGDDGYPRTVLTLFKGNGKMYQVSQTRGNSYKVNDEHILTLCMPEHKSIHWANDQSSWRSLYWDKLTKTIKVKQIHAPIKTKCDLCDKLLDRKSLRKHYKRKHNTKLDTNSCPVIDLKEPSVVRAHLKLQEFLSTIDDNNIIDISIQDYLKIKSQRHKLKGFRGECVNWEHKDVLLDPYVLGLWLGDGMQTGYSYACHSEKDTEIINYLEEWGKDNDAQFTRNPRSYEFYISSIKNYRQSNCSPLKKLLSNYNLINNKHIPQEYLINSREIRLKVLAGLIDTDGYVHKDGTIEIAQSFKHKKLVDDIIYLSRSLGFYTYVREKVTNYKYKSGELAQAYIIKISGDICDIPTLLPRKKPLSTNKYNVRNITGKLDIKEIPDENYVGIGIDGNNRFLINDFTVTHNCLNIRDATVQQLMNNEEINNLKQIIGLKQGKEYENTSDLRYGKVMCLTDADVDGSHIKGLLINFFHAQWPSLVKLNFIQTLRTPIVKAIRGNRVHEFFTQQEYEEWRKTNSTTGYQIKYYKGLGTSTKEDAQKTFKRIADLQVDYYYKDKKCDDAILLAFEKDKNVKKTTNDDVTSEDDTLETGHASTSNEIVGGGKGKVVKCADKRKQWLGSYDKDTCIGNKESKVSYQDFIHKELIHFSIYDNLRSIPSLCDGLKPSQRKILYYMLQRNITKSIKVAQLSGYVSAETSYHHGEASLQQAIIGMAQDFIGSNNINWLVPDGNFGSRINGGKDAASPRYIFTYLAQLTKLIFDNRDTPLLTLLEEDGQKIEPEWYIPVIPTVLVNGCEGIGTGYSTYIPPHDTKDIVANIIRVLDDKQPVPMKPHFRNFSGEILDLGEGSYATKGKWEKISDTQIRITELPVGTWITPYKEFLESLIEGGSSNKPAAKTTTATKTKSKSTKRKTIVLKDVRNKTTDENTGISFILEFKDPDVLDDLIQNGTVEKELRLIKTFSTNNMYLFDDRCVPTKYRNTTDILLDFVDIRMDFYTQRREYIMTRLRKELSILQSKVRFINEYINNELDINRKSKDSVIQLLEQRGYKKFTMSDAEGGKEGSNSEGDNSEESKRKSYDYLIRMPIVSLTLEKIQELTKQTQSKKHELDTITNQTAKDLWRIDLDQILNKLN